VGRRRGLAPAPAPPAPLAHDIDDLRLALRRTRIALQAQRALQDAIIEATPYGVVIVDPRDKILAVSPSMRALLPVVPEPVGRPLKDAIPFPPLVEALRRAESEREMVDVGASWGRFDLRVRAALLPEDRGGMAVVTDVSEIAQLDRVRRDFVANVSHELRTPITSIRGYAETLLADPDNLDPLTAELLDAVERNARRMGDLIDSLLHLSRIEAGQADALASEELELGALALEVVGFYRDEAARRGLDLAVEQADASAGPIRIAVNREAFGHILGNLTQNAIKYTQEGGRVRIRVHAEDRWGVVDVEDNGPGIDPANRARIFERFYRVDRGRSRDAGGTGLGLAIVKHLCRAVGAEITVRSLPGRGSTFTVRFNRPPPPHPG